MSKTRRTTRNTIRAIAVNTFLDPSLRSIGNRADRTVGYEEPVCDVCGVKTKALRRHIDKMLCWTCKVSTIKD